MFARRFPPRRPTHARRPVWVRPSLLHPKRHGEQFVRTGCRRSPQSFARSTNNSALVVFNSPRARATRSRASPCAARESAAITWSIVPTALESVDRIVWSFMRSSSLARISARRMAATGRSPQAGISTLRSRRSSSRHDRLCRFACFSEQSRDTVGGEHERQGRNHGAFLGCWSIAELRGRRARGVGLRRWMTWAGRSRRIAAGPPGRFPNLGTGIGGPPQSSREEKIATFRRLPPATTWRSSRPAANWCARDRRPKRDLDQSASCGCRLAKCSPDRSHGACHRRGDGA